MRESNGLKIRKSGLKTFFRYEFLWLFKFAQNAIIALKYNLEHHECCSVANLLLRAEELKIPTGILEQSTVHMHFFSKSFG